MKAKRKIKSRKRKPPETARAESDAMLRATVEGLPCCFFTLDDKGRYTMQNSLCRNHWGDITGKRPGDIAPNAEAAALWKVNNRRVLRTGAVVESEMRFPENGRMNYHRNIISPIRIGGKIKGIVGLDFDITSRKRAEMDLRLHSEIMRHVAEGICMVRLDKEQIVYANPKMERMFGYDPEELLGKHVSTLGVLDAVYVKQLLKTITQGLDDEGRWQGEVHCKRREGATFWCNLSISTYEHPEFGMVSVGVYHDITRRKLAEDTLKSNTEMMQRVVNSSVLQMFLYQKEGSDFILREVNKAVRDLGGGEGASLLGRRLSEIAINEPKIQKAIRTCYREQSVNMRVEAEHKQHSTGVLRQYSAVCTFVPPDKVFVSAEDITERELAKRDAVVAERCYTELFEQAGDFILVLEPVGEGPPIIIDANEAAFRQHGYTRKEMIGRPVSMLETAESAMNDPQRLAQLAAEGFACFEVEHRRKNGSLFWAEVSAKMAEAGGRRVIMCIERDVTERKRAQAALIKGQKMESLGQLAGGLAHDFNNLLTAVIGNISIARKKTDSSDVRELIDETLDATRAAQSLAQQLLTFARGGKPVAAVVDMRALLKDAVVFAARGSKVKCVFSLNRALHPVKADAAQLTQVLQNIVINAVQAMPQGGKLRVRAVNTELAPANALALPAGSYASVEIGDEGRGIAAEHLEKVFEPYFSTKESGRGFGLAISHSIITKHGGHIAVQSTPGAGAVFTIHLPALPGVRPSAVEKTGRLKAGRGKLLIMDDEPQVAKVLSRIVKELGYTAYTAADGSKALSAWRKAKKAGQPFRAAIMDLTIPGGMGGEEAIKKLRRTDRAAVVIVSSGYANAPILANYGDYGFADVLVKPYRIGDVSKVLSRALSRRQ
ncbi:MAG: PAS domain S-box protein [Elusimicrobiota bacterium]